MGSNISLVRPTNVADGLRWGILVLPILLEALRGFFCFVFFWKHFSGEIFLVEGYLLFVFLFFWFFLVDYRIVHCPSFAFFAECPFGSLCPSPIFFIRFMATP